MTSAGEFSHIDAAKRSFAETIDAYRVTGERAVLSVRETVAAISVTNPLGGYMEIVQSHPNHWAVRAGKRFAQTVDRVLEGGPLYFVGDKLWARVDHDQLRFKATYPAAATFVETVDQVRGGVRTMVIEGAAFARARGRGNVLAESTALAVYAFGKPVTDGYHTIQSSRAKARRSTGSDKVVAYAEVVGGAAAILGTFAGGAQMMTGAPAFSVVRPALATNGAAAAAMPMQALALEGVGVGAATVGTSHQGARVAPQRPRANGHRPHRSNVKSPHARPLTVPRVFTHIDDVVKLIDYQLRQRGRWARNQAERGRLTPARSAAEFNARLDLLILREKLVILKQRIESGTGFARLARDILYDDHFLELTATHRRVGGALREELHGIVHPPRQSPRSLTSSFAETPEVVVGDMRDYGVCVDDALSSEGLSIR